ncbi:hypothetical protein BKA62DRAFT_601857, partial [Auriculariales sp. MPI-PUGE-AT-0066]
VAPFLIGCFLDLLTQGILYCQFNNYRLWYKDDPVGLRAAVYILIVLTTLKCIDSCAVVWVSFVEYFGDIDGARMLPFVAWYQVGVPLMGAVINFYAQLYFMYRLFVISERHWVIFPIGLVVVFAFLAVIIATVHISLLNRPDITQWLGAHTGATFAADLLVTITTASFLLLRRKNSLSQTKNLIDLLVRVSWQSAAPAAVCATINLVMSQAYKGYIIATIPNQLYAMSMIWTINSRKNIRSVIFNSGMSSNVSNSRTCRTTDDVELGRIAVHKQIETVSHVD